MAFADDRPEEDFSDQQRREGIVRLLAEAYTLRLRRLGRLKPSPSKEDDLLGSYNTYGLFVDSSESGALNK